MTYRVRVAEPLQRHVLFKRDCFLTSTQGLQCEPHKNDNHCITGSKEDIWRTRVGAPCQRCQGALAYVRSFTPSQFCSEGSLPAAGFSQWLLWQRYQPLSTQRVPPDISVPEHYRSLPPTSVLSRGLFLCQESPPLALLLANLTHRSDLTLNFTSVR